MKKIIHLLMIMCLAVVLFASAGSVHAEEYKTILSTGSCGTDLIYTIYSDYELAISGSGTMTNYTYDSNTNKTNAPWENSKYLLQKITIGPDVTRISNYAFKDFKRLTAITIPNSVTSIGNCAFYGCSGLMSITIPESMTSIGYSAFSGCSGLTTVNYNAVNCYMGSSSWRVFSNNTNITTVNIGTKVQAIPNCAFYGFSGLTSIIIPDSVTSIGDYAFSNCSGLTSITIPDGVTSIDDYAFSGCSDLMSITIPDGVTSIGRYAFSGCSDLMSITIPDGVTSIGRYAFSDCSGLTSITIPNGVTSIGDYAFSGCSGLISITIPDGVTSIGSYAFSDCSSLTTVNYNAVNCIITLPEPIYYSPFKNCNNVTAVNIGEQVQAIPHYAFSDCDGLISITIPKNVSTIGYSAFPAIASIYFQRENCPELTSVYGSTRRIYSSTKTVYYPCNGKGYVYLEKDFPNAEFDIWHDYKWTITTQPTQESVGMVSGVCHTDSSHTDMQQLPALTDTDFWAVSIKPPACTEDGARTYISKYGEITEAISAIGHNYSSWTIKEKPMLTEQGELTRTCQNDNAHTETVPLAPLGDTSVWTSIVTKEATCTEDGERTYSSEYGEVTEIIPAGHSWAWTVILQPTDTEVGMATAICEKSSSHANQKVLEPLNDSAFWTLSTIKEATCTEDGVGLYVSEYGEITAAITATGHNYGNWTIKAEPTLTTQGAVTRTCQNDNAHTETVPLAPLGDTSVWTSSVTKEATCTEDGTRTYTSEYGEITEIIPAGHSWTWTILRQPSKESIGIASGVCRNDSNHTNQAILQPLNDSTFWTKGAYVAPTETTEGSQEYISEYGSVTTVLPKKENTLTEVKPGESVTKGDTTVTGSGDGTVTVENSGKGGNAIVVMPPSGENVSVDESGNVSVPSASEVIMGSENGSVSVTVALPNGGVIDTNSNITGEKVFVDNLIDIIAPDGKIVAMDRNGNTTVPAGTEIGNGYYETITVTEGNGVVVDKEGNITFPNGGKASINSEEHDIVADGSIKLVTDCTKITAEYDTDGVMTSVRTETIKLSDIVIVENTAIHKVFYWRSLSDMQPISKSSESGN